MGFQHLGLQGFLNRTRSRLLPASVSGLLLMSTIVGIIGISSQMTFPQVASAQTYDYGYYYRAGNQFYEQGKLTEAIKMYERAITLAQGHSIPVVYNNLAAIYMRRGNYFLSKEKKPAKALSDFQKAMYLMEYGWPEGMEYSSNQSNNRNIARQNLDIGYRNNSVTIHDVDTHRRLATEARQQGNFHQAVVEYGQVLVDAPTDKRALVALGDVFNVLNRMNKAKKYYVQAKKTVPSGQLEPELWVRLAHVSYQSGDVDLALQLLNQVADAKPDYTRALRQLESIWRKELQYDPQNPLAHANLASVFQKQHLNQKALSAYNNAERLAAQSRKITLEQKLDIRLNLGTLHQEMNNIPIATKAYESVLEKNPNHQRALYLLASLFRETHQDARALQYYNRLLALNPDNERAQDDMLSMIKAIPNPTQQTSELHQFASRYADRASVQSSVGEVFHGMGNTNEAIRYYEAALRLDTNLASAHANLGAAYREKGREQEALAQFKQAQALDPSNQTVATLVKESESAVWQTYYRDAVTKQQAGHFAGSLADFEKAVTSVGPADDVLTADFWLAYGLSYQQDGQLEQAMAQYDKAIAKSPDVGDAYFYRATVYHQQQVLGLAIRDYEQALAKPSLNETFKTQATEAISALKEAQVADALNQAMTAYGKKSYTQALNLLSQAEKLSPDEASIYYYRGLIYNDQKKYGPAIVQYEKAITLESTLDDVYYALGIVHENNKQPVKAKQSFQTYVQHKQGEKTPYTEYAQSRISAL